MNLGENIYRFRTEKNMSQGDLADALDVSRQSVSKWENNSATPELEKLLKMSQLFGITLDELVSGETPQPPPTPNAAPAGAALILRECIGAVMLCFAIVLAVISILFGEYWAEAGIYLALVLATIGCACCWPKKMAVMLSIFALDALFLFVLAAFSEPTSAAIFAIPFLIIFIIVMYQNSEDAPDGKEEAP